MEANPDQPSTTNHDSQQQQQQQQQQQTIRIKSSKPILTSHRQQITTTNHDVIVHLWTLPILFFFEGLSLMNNLLVGDSGGISRCFSLQKRHFVGWRSIYF